jgi:hypothetical protein
MCYAVAEMRTRYLEQFLRDTVVAEDVMPTWRLWLAYYR